MIKKITDEDLVWIRKRVNTKVAADIAEFINSGDSACEVVISDYKSPQAAFNAYKQSAKRAGYGVKFTVRGKRLFMYKEEV